MDSLSVNITNDLSYMDDFARTLSNNADLINNFRLAPSGTKDDDGGVDKIVLRVLPAAAAAEHPGAAQSTMKINSAVWKKRNTKEDAAHTFLKRGERRSRLVL